MITIRQLTNISIDEIHNAFKDAFSDYAEPFDLTKAQLQYMIERRGFNFELSFGAFNNNTLVGFTLNGVDEWNNKLTAYDTGTGIVKEYRRQGLASKMFNDSIPILKKHGIKQYLLEVIKTNVSAFDLYKKAGFKITREFDYYTAAIDQLKINSNKEVDGVIIKEIKPDWKKLKSLWDFNPSWQNSVNSIDRKIEHFRFLGAYKNNDLVGYGIVEPHTGDIPQLCVGKNYRKLGVGMFIFSNLVKLITGSSLKIINVSVENEPFKIFAKSINLTSGFGQYEMILDI